MRSRHLTWLALGAALWVVLVSACGAALSALGWWSPWVAWPVAVGMALASGWCVRGIPAVRMPGTAAAALVAVVLGFTVWAGATHSEQVLPRRDAASNLQATVSLASTHARVVPVDAESVGGAGVLALDGVTLASPAFFQVGSVEEPAVQPQFVVGPAVVYSYGWWAGGAAVALALPAVAMGLALLALGLLVARVVGPWAAVAAAAATGVLFPVLHAARATYSEPLAMLTLTSGLLALTVAAGAASVGVRPGWPRSAAEWSSWARDGSTRAALLAGLLVGGTGLVRVDALREVVLLLPVLALGAALGARWVRPVLVGLGTSVTVAAVAALALSSQYLRGISGSLVPLLALGVLVGLVSGAALLLRGRGRGVSVPEGLRRRMPDAAGAAVLLLGVYLASRPLWQVVRQDPDDPGARYVAGMQARQGLPVDGGRTYAEQTVTWLAWYVGPVALVVALVVLAALVRRAVGSVLRGDVEAWVPALVVAAGSTLLTLLRPGITPDHPWADRRLLVALPLVVVLVVTGLDWVLRRAVVADRPRTGAAVAAAVGLLVVAPALVATWPHRAGGVERGSLAAVARVCAALGPQDVVLAVDSRAANEWPQVVRGMCGVPALSTTPAVRRDAAALSRTVGQVQEAVTARGGRLVLLAADSTEVLEALEALGVAEAAGAPVVDVGVREDEHVLERPPVRTDPLPIRVWLAAAG